MPARRFLLALGLAIASLALAPAAAYAHEGHEARALTLTAWTWDPSVILGIVALLGLYLYRLGRLEDSERPAVPPWRVALFLAGLATIFLALESPLDLGGDEYLFTFHMAQHQLLMMVAPPLLLLGTPEVMLRPLLERRALATTAGVLTFAPVAFLLFNGALWAWHAPALYEAALENDNVHLLQHLTFLATAVLFWWPVIGLPSAAGRGTNLPIGGRMIYLGLAIASNSFLAVIIGFSSRVLYPFYDQEERLWGISALADQQMGGALMWVMGSMGFFMALSILFFALLEQEERRASVGTGN
jgi:cytochrome c oxidase assembly factor CtaG